MKPEFLAVEKATLSLPVVGVIPSDGLTALATEEL
jgi:hypothetical protein